MIRFLARQKLRFDLGQSFLAIANLAFVVIAASDKLTTLLHLEARYIFMAAVPAALLGVWLAGWALDRMGFYHHYTDELNERNRIIKALEKP